MVYFRSYGRMGNFLFMAANAIGYAHRHGLDYSIPNWTNNQFWNPIYLQHLHNPWFNNSLETVTVKEMQFHYKEIPFDESWRNKNILLDGYWQSYKYFHEYRDKILWLFHFPWDCLQDTCAVHARFGDYLTIPRKHILVDEPYLISAIDLIKASTGITKFKVFSDDLQYFKNNLGHIYDFEYSSNNDIEKDLIEMSCCHSQIMSSSTFSFWGAYLNRNPDKVIITQQKWFQDGWSDGNGVVDTSDILLPEWIKI